MSAHPQAKYIEKRKAKMAGLHNVILKEIIKRGLLLPEVYIVLDLVKNQVLENFEKGIIQE